MGSPAAARLLLPSGAGCSGCLLSRAEEWITGRPAARLSRPDGCTRARALAKDGMLCERQRSRLGWLVPL